MKKYFIILALLLVIIYWFFGFVNFDWIENLELVFLNFRFKLRGPIEHSDIVKIVAIDDHSLSYLYENEGNSWPLSRDVYARAIDKLAKAGVKSIVMDISFDSYRDKGRQGDEKFAQTLFMYPYVSIGTILVNNKDEFYNLDPQYRERIIKSQDYKKFAYKIANINKYYEPEYFSIYKMIPPADIFEYTVYGYGTFEIGLPDADGYYHSIPLIINEDFSKKEGQGSLLLLPNLDILGLAAFLDLKAGEWVWDIENKKINMGDKLEFPVDSNGYYNINYYGKKAFAEISLVDVLNEDIETLKKMFSNKMVFFGYTAQAKGIFDVRPTPFNNNEAGIQLHATLLANILEGDHFYRLPFWLNLLLIFVLLLISFYILQIPVLKYSIILDLLLIVSINIINYLLFINNIWMDLFYLDFVLIVYLLFNVITKVIHEYRERMKTKSYFSRYVPEEVVEQILSDPSLINPGGEEKELTVLFTDIVGFTAISEQLTPSELVRLLNEYLSEMSYIIKKSYKGTLDKFIGDAIVAIFGAPFESPDDPVRAVEAALAMRDKVDELQKKWRERGEKVVFDMGLGINTGQAVVGNIGSKERVNYTCIGDSVNVAARLEAATRDTDCKILISESTYQKVKEHFICEKIDNLRVKGKTEALTVYKVHGKKD